MSTTTHAPTAISADNFCMEHTNVRAEWRCIGCGASFCDACMRNKPDPRARLESCPRCRGFCKQIDLSHLSRPKDIGDLLGDAIAYPFRGSALLLIGLGSMFLAFMQLLSMSFYYGWFFAAFGAGYLAAYLFRVIVSSAKGESDLPGWPEFTDFYDSIVVPFFQMFVPSVLCILAAAAPIFYFGITPVGLASCIAIAIAGSFYLPMALLSVALNDSVAAMKPSKVIPAIQAVFGQYLLCVIILGSLAGISATLQSTISQAIPILGFFVNSFVSTVLVTMEVRLLGSIYHANRDRLELF